APRAAWPHPRGPRNLTSGPRCYITAYRGTVRALVANWPAGRRAVSRLSGGLAGRFRWNGPQPTGLVGLERLGDLVRGVHHKRAVLNDGLADRLAAHDVELQRRGVAVLAAVGADADHVPGAQDRELPAAHRSALATDVAIAAEDVDQRVEVRPPGQVDLRAGLDRGVDDGDGRVRGARPAQLTEIAGDQAQQGSAIGRAEERHGVSADVLVARGHHLVAGRQVDPQL